MDGRIIQNIVDEVVGKVAAIVGADGSKGIVLAVFSGATVGMGEVVNQLRRLILDGYEVKMVFTTSAEQLYAPVIHDGLAGFPHQGRVSTANWLGCLKQVRAVIVPLLSVNTAAKIRMLIADNTATNCILHGLFMGKPVIVARDGVDPTAYGRKELGFHRGSKALRDAMDNILNTLVSYGCRMTDAGRLRDTVNTVLSRGNLQEEGTAGVPDTHGRVFRPAGPLVTAADINHAQRLGAAVMVQPQWRFTPLAQDLAARYGILMADNEEF